MTLWLPWRLPFRPEDPEQLTRSDLTVPPHRTYAQDQADSVPLEHLGSHAGTCSNNKVLGGQTRYDAKASQVHRCAEHGTHAATCRIWNERQEVCNAWGFTHRTDADQAA